MARNVKRVAAGCASALMVLFAVGCGGQATQDTTKPATETSQAPAQQAAPAEAAAAPAPAEGAAPAQGQAPAQQKAPAEGQQAPPQQ